MKTKQFILLAPPGIKIQEHAVELAERWQIPYVSLRDWVQSEAAKETAEGREIRSCLETDELLPDALVLKLMRRRFEQPDTVLKGWVLIGFPQTLIQARGFDEWWSKMGNPLPTVVYLKAMVGILLNRLSTAPGQTESVPAIRRRLEQYETGIEPILTYYHQQNQLKTINGSLSFAEVARYLTRLGQEYDGAARMIRDEAELDTLITNQSKLVVDCMASWCGSCKQVTPSIDKLAAEYRDRVAVMKIDFDANRHISKRFALKGIPAVMYFKDSELAETLTGVKSYAEYEAAVIRLLN